jgi:alpha-aminoadipic semialdehyde synthase
MGIKEPPIPSLAPLLTPHDNKRRTHLMFSHTHKGQAYNFPLLRTLLANDGPRVIDYELLTAPPCDGGKRVVGFGHFAGIAGTIEGLIANALDHLSKGVASPFLVSLSILLTESLPKSPFSTSPDPTHPLTSPKSTPP